MKQQKFEIKPQNYGFPSNIAGMNINTITWKDFPAKPPENTWFLAFTYWNTNYTCTTKNGRSTVLATVKIGPKAWTRAHEDFPLLQHQTGHYWIACHCALEFQKRVNYTEKRPEGIPFLQWCQSVFKKTSSQFSQEQKRYDKQTYHYLIEDEQKRWKKQMIAKFNAYHEFFEQKRKEEQKNEALVKAALQQNLKNNAIQKNRVLKSVPPVQRTNIINQSKPNLNPTFNVNVQGKRGTRQFSVRKTATKFTHKPPIKNVTSFQQAKNTILGNIQLLQGLK